jgi:hypothetical protein
VSGEKVIAIFARACRRLWSLLNRRRLERELEREMESHRAQMADSRDFGNAIRLRERSADVWGWTWLDNLRRDLRHGARLLLKSPGFTYVLVQRRPTCGRRSGSQPGRMKTPLRRGFQHHRSDGVDQ